MKKTETAAHKEEAVVMPTVNLTPPETTGEVKPKMIFAPEVEQAAGGPVEPAAVTGAVTEPAAVIQPTQPEVKPEQPETEVKPEQPEVKPEQKAAAAKPEVPAGELARSIDTLAKIVDPGKPAEQTEGVTPAAGGKDGGEKKGSGLGLGVALAFVIGFGLGIIAGYVLWGRFVIGGIPVMVENEQVMDKQASLSPTPEVSPTPIAGLKRTEIKIKVLNGTGSKGVAAAGKEYLEGLGYADVATGNAKRSDYTKTEVVLGKDKAAYWSLLKEDLAKKYTLADGFTTDDELLAASGGYDALVIIGEE